MSDRREQKKSTNEVSCLLRTGALELLCGVGLARSVYKWHPSTAYCMQLPPQGPRQLSGDTRRTSRPLLIPAQAAPGIYLAVHCLSSHHDQDNDTHSDQVHPRGDALGTPSVSRSAQSLGDSSFIHGLLILFIVCMLYSCLANILTIQQVSTYSFEDHKKTSQIRALYIESGHSVLLVDDVSASEPVWLGDDEFLHLKSGENGSTSLMVRRAMSPNSA